MLMGLAPTAASAALPSVPAVAGNVTPTSVTPANGATVPTGSDVKFSASFSPNPPSVSFVYLVTSDSSAVGSDGRLVNGEYSTMSASYNAPTFMPGSPYTSSVLAVLPSFPSPTNQWPSQAGAVRYWQVWVHVLTGGAGTNTGTYISPVYSVTVGTPAPAAPPPTPTPTTPPAPTTETPAAPTVTTLAWTDAINVIRPIIRDETGRSPSNLRRSCARKTAVQVDCKLSWYDAVYAYAGKLWIGVQAGDTENVYYGFTGLRASLKCGRKHSIKFCSRSVKW